MAHETEALATKDLEHVAVDTAVQPKAVAEPIHAGRLHRVFEKLVTLAKRTGVLLRQSDIRVAKRAPAMVGRLATHISPIAAGGR